MPPNPHVDDDASAHDQGDIYEPPPCELASEIDYGGRGTVVCTIFPDGDTPTPEATRWIIAWGDSFVDLEGMR